MSAKNEWVWNEKYEEGDFCLKFVNDLGGTQSGLRRRLEMEPFIADMDGLDWIELCDAYQSAPGSFDEFEKKSAVTMCGGYKTNGFRFTISFCHHDGLKDVKEGRKLSEFIEKNPILLEQVQSGEMELCVVGVDPGVVNAIGVATIELFEYLRCFEVHSKEGYNLFNHPLLQFLEKKPGAEKLSERLLAGRRSMDASEYAEFILHYIEDDRSERFYGDGLHSQMWRSYQRKMRFIDKIIRDVFACGGQDCSEKNPFKVKRVVVYALEDGKFTAGSGHLASIHAIILDKLMRVSVSLNRIFVLVPPSRTSSVCPICLADVCKGAFTHRIKRCDSVVHEREKGLYWSRDVLGAYCSAYVAWCAIQGIGLPNAFKIKRTEKKDKDEKKKEEEKEKLEE